MEEIDTKGFDVLTEKEKEIVNKLLDEYSLRIERFTKNPTSLKLHLKEYSKENKQKKVKYSINAEIVSSGKVFTANAHDWDLSRTMHKLLNKLISEIEHHYHVSEQK